MSEWVPEWVSERFTQFTVCYWPKFLIFNANIPPIMAIWFVTILFALSLHTDGVGRRRANSLLDWLSSQQWLCGWLQKRHVKFSAKINAASCTTITSSSSSINRCSQPYLHFTLAESFLSRKIELNFQKIVKDLLSRCNCNCVASH